MAASANAFPTLAPLALPFPANSIVAGAFVPATRTVSRFINGAAAYIFFSSSQVFSITEALSEKTDGTTTMLPLSFTLSYSRLAMRS